MVIKEILEKPEELLSETTTGAERACDVRSCQIDSGIDVVLFKNAYVTLEVTVDENQLLNRNIEHVDAPN